MHDKPQFSRYAIYYTPPNGALATFGAQWLGWDIETGCAVPHPEIAGLPAPISEITATPRKYGLHGTIKPPFRLAEGTTADGLKAAFSDLAAQLPAVSLDGLELTRLGGFLALTIRGDQTPLADLAGSVVQELDAFRARPSEAELERRRMANLSPRQEDLLMQWGYPYVMDEFRFHITLTGRLGKAHLAQVTDTLDASLTGLLPSPFSIPDLALMGEDAEGRFHLIHRYTLSG